MEIGGGGGVEESGVHRFIPPSLPGALQLKFSRATGLWTSKETCAYIGKLSGMKGRQRAALWVQFLHQEERLSR